MTHKSHQRKPSRAAAVLVIAVAFTASALAAPGAVHAGEPLDQPPGITSETIVLRDGDSAFWDGAYVEQASVPNHAYVYAENLRLEGEKGGYCDNDPAGMCDLSTELVDHCNLSDEFPCWSYQIDVQRPDTPVEATLRVAVDSSSRHDVYAMELRDPTGRIVAQQVNDFTAGIFQASFFNLEARVPDPQPGLWTVRITPLKVEQWGFRMRAALLREQPAPQNREALMPNLQVVPPHEFTFAAPANPVNGKWPPDSINPPLGTHETHPPVSCAADETLEDAGNPTRCLRFTTGPTNVGSGPMELEMAPNDGNCDPLEFECGDVTQVVRYTKGDAVRYPAGRWQYHKTHGHNHYLEILTYELFTASPEGEITDQIGRGVKSGFCPGDQKFGDWNSFNQFDKSLNPRAYEAESDCQTGMALSTGWGDVYRWQRPGQYVPFPQGYAPLGGDPSYFVVRATVDNAGRVAEADETDNTAYALVKVQGEQIQICESGRGLGPQDPAGVTVGEWWLDLPGGPGSGC